MYVKSQGYTPVTMTGNGYGDLLRTGAKAMGKYVIPMAKNVWSSLTPETKEQLIESGIDYAGTKVEYLGEQAQKKLTKLLRKEKSDGKISKEATTMLKKLVKTGKKKAKTKAKGSLLPASGATSRKKRKLHNIRK